MALIDQNGRRRIFGGRPGLRSEDGTENVMEELRQKYWKMLEVNRLEWKKLLRKTKT